MLGEVGLGQVRWSCQARALHERHDSFASHLFAVHSHTVSCFSAAMALSIIIIRLIPRPRAGSSNSNSSNSGDAPLSESQADVLSSKFARSHQARDGLRVSLIVGLLKLELSAADRRLCAFSRLLESCWHPSVHACYSCSSDLVKAITLADVIRLTALGAAVI